MRYLIFLLIALLSYAPDLLAGKNVKEQLQGINQQISEKKRLLKKTRKVEAKVSGELQQIENSLSEKEANLKALNQKLVVVESSLDRTGQEIEKTRTAADVKRQEIQKRLVALYKGGELGNTRIVFSSSSFPQMTENVRYMRAVIDNDRHLFADYSSRISRLKELKGSLEQDAHKKETIKSGILASKQEIEEEKRRKAVVLSQVKQDKQGYLASLRVLQANARRLQSMVERLEAASRKSYTPKGRKRTGMGTVPSLPPVPDRGFASQKGRLSLPVRGQITEHFGKHKHPEFNSFTFSNGISVSAPNGSDIRAIYDGKVIFASYFKGYGNMLIIDHGGGYYSLYAHASRILKKVGADVSRNEVIASVGDVDSTRGPMLYFEIRHQGKPVDPDLWLR